MRSSNYTAPSIGLSAFNCPHPRCGAHAQQHWKILGVRAATAESVKNRSDPAAEPHIQGVPPGHAFSGQGLIEGLFVSECNHCHRPAIWMNGRITWPTHGDAPPPNPDLSQSVLKDYEEAGAIASVSPRGAAALLRLAVEKLCGGLVPDMDNLNDGIGKLVNKGLDERIQQSLDIVRVIGNNAVHPGQIDLDDDPNTVARLFRLVNIVAETMITTPKEIEETFGSLPKGARQAIEKRDGPKSKS